MRMKVDDIYVKQAIEEYEASIHPFDDDIGRYPSTIINGAVYYIVNMSLAEFIRQKNATLLEDIVWGEQ